MDPMGHLTFDEPGSPPWALSELPKVGPGDENRDGSQKNSENGRGECWKKTTFYVWFNHVG